MYAYTGRSKAYQPIALLPMLLKVTSNVSQMDMMPEIVAELLMSLCNCRCQFYASVNGS